MVFWDIGALLAIVPMLVFVVPVAGFWRAQKIIIHSVMVNIIMLHSPFQHFSIVFFEEVKIIFST
jgi:hypothetical protein